MQSPRIFDARVQDGEPLLFECLERGSKPQIPLDALRRPRLLHERLRPSLPLVRRLGATIHNSSGIRCLRRLRLRPFVLRPDRLQRRDPLACDGFALLAQPRPVVGDQFRPVPRATDLDVEHLLRGHWRASARPRAWIMCSSWPGWWSWS